VVGKTGGGLSTTTLPNYEGMRGRCEGDGFLPTHAFEAKGRKADPIKSIEKPGRVEEALKEKGGKRGAFRQAAKYCQGVCKIREVPD